MASVRKNEAKIDIDLFNFIRDNKKYKKSWTVKKSNNKYIQECLDIASKKSNDQRGEPDLIYVNEDKKLLILVENKDGIKYHASKNGDNPILFAVDGIKHYLSFFISDKINKETTSKYLKSWSIVGIAFSGNINDEYNHLISTFIIIDNSIKDIETKEILDEEDYVAFFENIDLEKISRNISKSSSEINRMLRTLDSQKRPVLLSALMICLYEKEEANDFKRSYSNWKTTNIIRNIPTTIQDILKGEGIDDEKIDVLINELAFIKTDNDLNSSDILKDILKELEENVIPLFKKKTNYDIIGKFYEEFLRYAGITNVKKGIVLTPSHITKLFTELIEIKTNDVIIDICAGTGAFLIAGMNKLISEIEESSLSNKTSRIKNIKENQLIGLEKSSTMYSLAISNMLFRGDGKSRIFNVDAFSEKSDSILKKLKRNGINPTIGFINPPYGGNDNNSNPTKKEIQFLEKMLDMVSRYGVIIAPLSTFFKDTIERNRILSKHTLKYVINTPGELFQPNAATHTAIAVFETNTPHNNKKVVLVNLSDDGFILSKHRGRTDILNRWIPIKKMLLEKLKNPTKYQDNHDLVYTQIKEDDEWIIQAHSRIDYSKLTRNNFVDTVKKYVIFSIKLKLDLLEKNIDEITFLEILNENIILNKKSKINSGDKSLLQSVNIKGWREFKICEIFTSYSRGMRLTGADREKGEMPFYSASDYNNGLIEKISNPLFVERDALIYTIFGKCYYVEGEFTASDDTSIFKHEKLNLFNGLFIATIINQNKSKYTFGRKAFYNKFSNDVISLPVTSKGELDWNYMENYMKSLPYSSLI